MMTIKALILSVPLALLSLSACTTAERATTLPPGEYENSTKSVDRYGTETKKDTNTKVYYDEYGNKKATVDTKTSRDPKGLFNKSTSETRQQVQ